MIHQNISIIVAIAENFAIGKNNDLLFHLPNDLKRFKQITLGKPVIMGRNTFLSLPGSYFAAAIYSSTTCSRMPSGMEPLRSTTSW
ncbi:MAG: dihydrofolate reductase [Anaerolineales bacterium]|nr:dihydrofolate reductase [Anaerolineales bacterium]